MNSNDKTQLGSGSSNYRNKADQLQAGTIIDNRYEIKEKLGSGGFGAVYKVWDKELSLYKAIKVVHPEFYDESITMQKLRDETRIMMQLNVQEAVRVFDVNLQGELQYITMEFLDGEDLASILSKRKKLPEDEVLTIAKQIAKGMAAIHKENILHLDLKPANIHITSKGQVKIMDFGIAQALKSGTKSRLQEASKSGTLAYMSPEQLLGLNVGKESDIWSFGIMVYQMLTGELLYNAPSFRDIDFQMEKRPFVGDEDLSEKMNELLKGCLVYEYKKRQKKFNNFLEISQESIKKVNNEKKTVKPKCPKISQSKSYGYSKTLENIIEQKNDLKEIKNSVGMEFILVPRGKFIMGSNIGNDFEKPAHEVMISKSFYLGKYVITTKEWDLVMNNTNNGLENNFLPKVNINYSQIIKFIKKLNKNEIEKKYRLPTEAEWEYACKGSDYSEKKENQVDLLNKAWLKENSQSGFLYFRSIKPIGQKLPNEFGLYDMIGNVWECVSDWFEYPYQNLLQVDPKGAINGEIRIIKGGSYKDSSTNIKPYTRGLWSKESYDNYNVSRSDIGFRLVLEIKSTHELKLLNQQKTKVIITIIVTIVIAVIIFIQYLIH